MDHGRKPRQPRSAQAKAKEARQISEYNSITADMIRMRDAGDMSTSALDLTTRVLEINPEYTSAWNYRRTILRDGFLADVDDQQRQSILNNDLHLTSVSLRKNPKNYAVWEHRKWLLRTMPDPDWGFELKMVEKQLDQDARNFHGWNYRRHIVASCRHAKPPPVWSTVKRPVFTLESEMAYTRAKISANFSNFSAWHYRSKLLDRLPEEAQIEKRKDELELVRHALWTDPNDQSGWLYHAWLIGEGNDAATLQHEIASIEDLLEMEPGSKWCLDALIRYKTMLLVRHSPATSSAQLRQACADACSKLCQLDPARARRYQWLLDQIPP